MAYAYFLGTSGSVASPKRDNTAYLVKADRKKAILIDCPGSVVQKLARLGVDFRAVSDVFLTHSHADHTYGLPSLIQSQYMLHNTLRIYAHEKTLALVRTLQKAFGLDNPRYPRLKLRPLKPGQRFFRSGTLSASCFRVSHLPGSLGYSVAIGRRRTVFSGDTAYSENVIKAAAGSDTLIHDCFCPERIFRRYPRLYTIHTSSLQLGLIARSAGVKTLIPIHFGSEVKYSMREITDEIRKHFKSRLIIPSDGFKLQISK